MRQGLETREFGRRLAAHLLTSAEHRGWFVYYDHGDATLDANVAATKGFFGTTVKNLNRLADIDVLVASPDGMAQLLIEIEERACSPKKILGDILAVLLCNQFAVRVQGHQQKFAISPSTKLIVAGVVPDRGQRLLKVEEIIQPRIHQLQGLPDAISPTNVELVFSATLQQTLNKLNAMITDRFPSSAA
ncbi:MAG: hypothetical protein M1343_10110 [Chloroflexi bacterium]|nr:hypothetical protein [Chloroflexota bacterium]